MVICEVVVVAIVDTVLVVNKVDFAYILVVVVAGVEAVDCFFVDDEVLD